MAQCMLLPGFEQEAGHLAQVEADGFGFMCHATTEVPHHDAVPGGLYFLSNSLMWAAMSFSVLYFSNA